MLMPPAPKRLNCVAGVAAPSESTTVTVSVACAAPDPTRPAARANMSSISNVSLRAAIPAPDRRRPRGTVNNQSDIATLPSRALHDYAAQAYGQPRGSREAPQMLPAILTAP